MNLRKLFAPLDDSMEAKFKKLESDALSIGNMDWQDEEQYFMLCFQAFRLKSILYSDISSRLGIAQRLWNLKTNWSDETKMRWGAVVVAFGNYEHQRKERLSSLL